MPSAQSEVQKQIAALEDGLANLNRRLRYDISKKTAQEALIIGDAYQWINASANNHELAMVGDAAIVSVVAAHFSSRDGDFKRRVSTEALANLAGALGLDDLAIRGNIPLFPKQKAGLYRAIIGAIVRDHGYEAAVKVIKELHTLQGVPERELASLTSQPVAIPPAVKVGIGYIFKDETLLQRALRGENMRAALVDVGWRIMPLAICLAGLPKEDREKFRHFPASGSENLAKTGDERIGKIAESLGFDSSTEPKAVTETTLALCGAIWLDTINQGGTRDEALQNATRFAETHVLTPLTQKNPVTVVKNDDLPATVTSLPAELLQRRENIATAFAPRFRTDQPVKNLLVAGSSQVTIVASVPIEPAPRLVKSHGFRGVGEYEAKGVLNRLIEGTGYAIAITPKQARISRPIQYKSEVVLYDVDRNVILKLPRTRGPLQPTEESADRAAALKFLKLLAEPRNLARVSTIAAKFDTIIPDTIQLS